MANVSETNKPSMAGIGETLREAREKKAVTIEQAQKQTRIHSTVLSALEEGRCDEILAPNYVKSFLREYANYLGLDAKELGNKYATLHPELRASNINLGKGLEPKGGAVDLSGLVKAIKFTVIIIIAAVLAIFLFKSAAKFFKPKFARSPAGAGNIQSIPQKAQSKKKPSAKAGFIQRDIPRSVPLAMVLKVKQPVMVQLKKDGVLLFRRVLPKGTIESVTANDNINIYVARAEAISLTLNGKAVEGIGKGVIKNLEITRSGIKFK